MGHRLDELAADATHAELFVDLDEQRVVPVDYSSLANTRPTAAGSGLEPSTPGPVGWANHVRSDVIDPS